MPHVQKLSTATEASSDAMMSSAVPKELSVDIAKRDADLSICPKLLPVEAGYQHISLGDLHGNAIKLLYTLIEEGFLELGEENYNELYNIYSKDPNKLNTEDINKFRSILAFSKFNNNKSLTLIGDELSDRGMNDWFTLLILKRLHEAKVDVDILISNHGVDFMHKINNQESCIGILPGGKSPTRSYDNMITLVRNGIISEEEIKEIITEHYIPMFKALNYSISDKGELTIYSHAPIGLETIEEIAERLSVAYDDKNQSSLMRTIDEINEKIKQLFYSGELEKVLREEDTARFISDSSDADAPISLDYPLIRLIWNRNLGKELRMESKYGKFAIKNVHGHIGHDPIKDEHGIPRPTHQNLDNNFGKDPSYGKSVIPSFIEHFTRRSSDNIKSQLYALMDEIRSYKIDKDVLKHIEKDISKIGSTTDKASLLKIRARLKGFLHVQLIEKSNCYIILEKIRSYSNEGVKDLVKFYNDNLAKETNIANFKLIKNHLEIYLSRLELINILDEIISYPMDNDHEFKENYNRIINEITDKDQIEILKNQLELECSKRICKKELTHILLHLAKFDGMEGYVAAKKSIIDSITDIDDFRRIKIELNHRKSELDISFIKAKIHTMIDEVKAILLKYKGPETNINPWVEQQIKTVYALTNIVKLEEFKSALADVINHLILKAKLRDLHDEAKHLLSGFEDKKCVEEQYKAIKTLMGNISDSSDDNSINKTITEITSIIHIIKRKTAEMEMEKVETGRAVALM